jgi:L-2-hydroxyglutarate oxidase LhgO
VIHAGFNYPSASLKAKLCLEGNRKLYELCESHAIDHRQTGKIVVANSEDEIDRLHLLYAQDFFLCGSV